MGKVHISRFPSSNPDSDPELEGVCGKKQEVLQGEEAKGIPREQAAERKPWEGLPGTNPAWRI